MVEHDSAIHGEDSVAMAKKIKCPWCGRPKVGFSKGGTLEPHVASTKVKCVGVGQPKHQVLWLREQKDAKEPKL